MVLGVMKQYPSELADNTNTQFLKSFRDLDGITVNFNEKQHNIYLIQNFIIL